MATSTFVFTATDLSSPSEFTVFLPAQIDEMQTAANHGARTRTAWLDAVGVMRMVRDDHAGIVTETGGGVANRYRQRAESSIVGVAWVTADDGSKHVRIIADRVEAPKSSYGAKDPKVFASDVPLLAVYPELAVKPVLKKDRKKSNALETALRDTLAADPLDAAARASLADLYAEQASEQQASEQQTALALVLPLTQTPATV